MAAGLRPASESQPSARLAASVAGGEINEAAWRRRLENGEKRQPKVIAKAACGGVAKMIEKMKMKMAAANHGESGGKAAWRRGGSCGHVVLMAWRNRWRLSGANGERRGKAYVAGGWL
jgi:hypothetical protein